MTWTIYEILCAISQKKYIGLTRQKLRARWWQHLSDARNRKGGLLHRAIRRYGVATFSIKQLSIATSFEEAVTAERAAIAAIGTVVPGGYNLTIGGDGVVGSARSEATRRKIGRNSANMSEATRKKISRSLTGRKMSYTDEQREAMRIERSSRRHTDAAKAKMSAWRLGKKEMRTPEGIARTVAGAKAAMTGKPKTPEHRAKIGAARKGMKFPDEWRANIAAANKRRPPPSEETLRKRSVAMKGKRHSPETVEKMRLSAQRRVASPEGQAQLVAAMEAAWAVTRARQQT